MRARLVLLAAGISVVGQDHVLSPTAEFDLNAQFQTHRFRRQARSYLAAAPSGLTFVTIDEGTVLVTWADLDGRILHSRSDLASVHAQIYAALPRPDGSVWLVSSDPYRMLEPFGAGTGFGSSGSSHVPAPKGPGSTATRYTDLDLYSPSGAHLESLRLLAFMTGSESPIAAANSRLVLRSTSSQDQFIHFGTVIDSQFKEQTRVRIAPPVTGAIPVLASNGNLLLVAKDTGNMVVVDQSAGAGSVVRLAKPSPVRAAAADADSIYLLTKGAILKTDLAGRVVSTYRLQVPAGFEPATLSIMANSLYLVDKAGHAERFQIN